MEATPTEVVERAAEIFNREFREGQEGVSADARALYADEPLIVPFRAALEGTRYSGPTALDDWVADTRESWAWLRVEPEEVRELDANRVLMIATLVGCGRETGAETSAPVVLLGVVRDGRLAEARTFASVEDALAAADE